MPAMRGGPTAAELAYDNLKTTSARRAKRRRTRHVEASERRTPNRRPRPQDRGEKTPPPRGRDQEPPGHPRCGSAVGEGLGAREDARQPKGGVGLLPAGSTWLFHVPGRFSAQTAGAAARQEVCGPSQY